MHLAYSLLAKSTGYPDRRLGTRVGGCASSTNHPEHSPQSLSDCFSSLSRTRPRAQSTKKCVEPSSEMKMALMHFPSALAVVTARYCHHLYRVLLLPACIETDVIAAPEGDFRLGEILLGALYAPVWHHGLLVLSAAQWGPLCRVRHADTI